MLKRRYVICRCDRTYANVLMITAVKWWLSKLNCIIFYHIFQCVMHEWSSIRGEIRHFYCFTEYVYILPCLMSKWILKRENFCRFIHLNRYNSMNLGFRDYLYIEMYVFPSENLSIFITYIFVFFKDSSAEAASFVCAYANKSSYGLNFHSVDDNSTFACFWAVIRK